MLFVEIAEKPLHRIASTVLVEEVRRIPTDGEARRKKMSAGFVSAFAPQRSCSIGLGVCGRISRVAVRMSAGVPFEKYHGLGNDFILVDNRKSDNIMLSLERSASICDRRFGVGADGVIFLLPPEKQDSDFTMRIINSDGSEPEMCGNGIRCLAKFAFKLSDSEKKVFKIDTLAGLIVPEIQGDMVKVDMGEPLLEPKKVPTTLVPPAGQYETTYKVDGKDWTVVAVGMGNPHAVVFVTKDEFDDLDKKLEVVGPAFEHHETFPQRTNTEFINVLSRQEIDFLVWERGAGRTLACGTGACAAAVACILTGRTDRTVKVNLPGGPLMIEWNEANNHIFMTGPAEPVYTGTVSAS
eukprot:Plantae.Rhodophyta-Purpureofilum_apyrenoidigerum.ctg15101.p1 GENE.Plantae.Rhodophyta-Purpureofilum_apyrenoidigerum.ctg15101~~Plantae.Rhodophyta-Purpureofilum_apyrenoidigerum.ctg15101.p1  ORF type:complete len:353 (-),score=61.15 Plantae.Rhodophyta-Purpureofilum_apyrenoidigerum.ctg15101:302-1360(-)